MFCKQADRDRDLATAEAILVETIAFIFWHFNWKVADAV